MSSRVLSQQWPRCLLIILTGNETNKDPKGVTTGSRGKLGDWGLTTWLMSDGLSDQQTANELFVFRVWCLQFIISWWHSPAGRITLRDTNVINRLQESIWRRDVRVDRDWCLRYNCLLAARRRFLIPVSSLRQRISTFIRSTQKKYQKF